MLIELELPGATGKKKWESVNTNLRIVFDVIKKVESTNNGFISDWDAEWTAVRTMRKQ